MRDSAKSTSSSVSGLGISTPSPTRNSFPLKSHEPMMYCSGLPPALSSAFARNSRSLSGLTASEPPSRISSCLQPRTASSNQSASESEFSTPPVSMTEAPFFRSCRTVIRRSPLRRPQLAAPSRAPCRSGPPSWLRWQPRLSRRRARQSLYAA